MNFTNLLTDQAVSEEIGHRIAAARIGRGLTQAQLAEAAGVSKRTVERLEDGGATQLDNLIRCLRALDSLEGFERLLPEPPVNPMDLVKGHKPPRARSRVRTPRRDTHLTTNAGAPATLGWVWGDRK